MGQREACPRQEVILPQTSHVITALRVTWRMYDNRRKNLFPVWITSNHPEVKLPITTRMVFLCTYTIWNWGISRLLHAQVLYLSLIDVIAFIMRCKSSYVITPTLLTILYIQVCTVKQYQVKDLPLFRGMPIYICIYIYISLSCDGDMDLIGYFPMGTSMMYANSAVMHIMTYISLSWL